jgi:hypothetical protein
MIWMAAVWELFLAEARSLLTTAICTAMHKMHVHQFIKQMTIYTVIFTMTQYKKVRISRYVL